MRVHAAQENWRAFTAPRVAARAALEHCDKVEYHSLVQIYGYEKCRFVAHQNPLSSERAPVDALAARGRDCPPCVVELREWQFPFPLRGRPCYATSVNQAVGRGSAYNGPAAQPARPPGQRSETAERFASSRPPTSRYASTTSSVPVSIRSRSFRVSAGRQRRRRGPSSRRASGPAQLRPGSRAAQVLRHVELVERDQRLRVVAHRPDVGRPHVHRHRLDLRTARFAHRVEVAVERRAGAPVGHVPAPAEPPVPGSPPLGPNSTGTGGPSPRSSPPSASRSPSPRTAR